jgi:group I intron endonuclease
MYTIYLAKNKVNGKCYVGQTRSTLEKRKLYHFYASKKANCKFQHAINKYGLDGFEWSILEENIPTEFADEKEIQYQKLYKVVEQGYNHFYRGNNGFNQLSSEEHSKISSLGGKSHRGKKESDETRKNISNGLKNSEKFHQMKNDPQYKKQRSIDSKSNWNDPNSVYNTANYRDKLRQARIKRFERDYENIKPKLVELLSSGCKKKEICEILQISYPTLQKYISLI